MKNIYWLSLCFIIAQLIVLIFIQRNLGVLALLWSFSFSGLVVSLMILDDKK